MKTIPLRFLVAALCVAAACAWAHSPSHAADAATRQLAPQQQPTPKKPIALRGLVQALKIDGLTTRELIYEIKTRGVTFELTPEAERELRGVGARPELIAAARANYRPSPDTSATPVPTPKPARRRGQRVAGEEGEGEGAMPTPTPAPRRASRVAARPDNDSPPPPTPRRGIQVAGETPMTPPAVAGRFHALVIGNNAYEFMTRLQTAEADAFTGQELFRDYVQEPVAGRAAQTPEYSPLRNSGHGGGDFVFIRRR